MQIADSNPCGQDGIILHVTSQFTPSFTFDRVLVTHWVTCSHCGRGLGGQVVEFDRGHTLVDTSDDAFRDLR